MSIKLLKFYWKKKRVIKTKQEKLVNKMKFKYEATFLHKHPK